jgi:carboxylesterase
VRGVARAYSQGVGALDRTSGYELPGDGPSCLLLHGFTGTTAELWPLAEALAAEGYRVSAPLLPGHGIGAPDLLDAGRDAWRTAALTALHALPPPVRVVGLSMGALLATCLAAAERQRVSRLALLAPAVCLTQPAALLSWAVHLFPSLPRHFPSLRTGTASDLRDPTLRATNPKNEQVSLYGLAELRRLQREALEAAPAVTAPTLVCLGARDRTVTRRGVRRLVRRLGGPTRFERFARSGHQLVLDFDRREVIAAVIAHFAPLEREVR